MAVLVLSVAGQALGGFLGGSLGAIIGNAAGALAGHLIDQALFGEDIVREGNRLEHLTIQSSTEGTSIAKVYGRTRITGQLIWATNFEEVVTQRKEGGKGGPSVTVRDYEYFANFAIGLCEGPITRVGRVWADGHLLDLTEFPFRLYHGDENQVVDSLIDAKQGADNAPAYRGLAYMVFDRISLQDFGNRIPQISVEVIREVEPVEQMIRAVTVIPGTTEFGYLTSTLTHQLLPGVEEPVNRHVTTAASDWEAAIDELVDLCPQLESVGLVVAWFGTDLRCGHCQIKPGVENHAVITPQAVWLVSGQYRSTAYLVSQIDGRPAYGGTPSDQSVVSAITDLKSRGLRVMLYPFIVMDIEDGNSLPDPYGGTGQAAYPWRGRITCNPAPGQPSSADMTAAAGSQIDNFVGTAGPSHFSVTGQSVFYTGPAEWSYRRMILHYAHLAQAAGGVDGFLIGSEMIGLTTVRDDNGDFPFVTALRGILGDVRSVVGAQTQLSYAADWSEYFGYHPQDGSGDVYFHLDPLWADPDTDFIGIDNYMPLADWRDGDHVDAQYWPAITDLDYLRSNIAGGEGFDWYYETPAKRQSGDRTPITDGAYSKPWVFRYKDLVAWWSNDHYDRPGGIESATPTGWAPQSKPIRFTEIGCPAIDRGANQPNVFVDPKSSESNVPYFSNGGRDDRMQRRFLEAVLSFWDPDHPDHVTGSNPTSTGYGTPMVDIANSHVWTWDARPFPIFPYAVDLWSDGPNWQVGHWVNGRMGAISMHSLVTALLQDFQFDDADIVDLDGVVDGLAIGGVVSPRSILEPLAQLFAFEAVDAGTRIRFQRRGGRPLATLNSDQFVDVGKDDAPLASIIRAQESELPNRVQVTFRRTGREFGASAISVSRNVGRSLRVSTQSLPIFAPASAVEQAAEVLLADLWAGRDRVQFALPPSARAFEVGDVVTVEDIGPRQPILIQKITDAGSRRVEGRTLSAEAFRPTPRTDTGRSSARPSAKAKPAVALLDLPVLRTAEEPHRPWIACFARPWPGSQHVLSSTSGESFAYLATVARPALLGILQTNLASGPVHRWDLVNKVTVITAGTLQSRNDLDVFSGSNTIAVRCNDGDWEILQFGEATLIAANTYQLSRLLRAQVGSEAAMMSGIDAGAEFVLLDRSLERLDIPRDLIGVDLSLRVGPPKTGISEPQYHALNTIFKAVGERPYSPVHVTADKDAGSGDITLSWIRRSRVGGDTWRQREVPLAEESEAYEVDILDGETVMRTASVSSPSWTYSEAKQTTDFGAPPSTFDVIVYQISASYGRGTGRRTTLHV